MQVRRHCTPSVSDCLSLLSPATLLHPCCPLSCRPCCPLSCRPCCPLPCRPCCPLPCRPCCPLSCRPCCPLSCCPCCPLSCRPCCPLPCCPCCPLPCRRARATGMRPDRAASHESLCCCEYDNMDGERSHLLACCCNCEAVDLACDRYAMPPASHPLTLPAPASLLPMVEARRDKFSPVPNIACSI